MSTLVVLAAGLARRYGATKQLDPVGTSGETLIDYAVFDAWRAGCTGVVFVIRDELRAAFESQLLPRWSGRLDAQLAVQRVTDAPPEYRTERTLPWGTGHALMAAARCVGGDALVCNADDFYGGTAYAALLQSLQQDAVAHAVAGYRLTDTLSPYGGVSRALCRTDARGFLERIEERTGVARAAAGIIDDRGLGLNDDTLVSMNLWAFHVSVFEHLDRAFAGFLHTSGTQPNAEFRIPDVVNDLVAAGRARVRVVPAAGEWFGMTYVQDRATVRERIAALVRAGAYPSNLFATV